MVIAGQQALESIAFPAISCGVYRFPWDEAAAIAARTIADEAHRHASLETVRMVLFGEDIYDCFARAFAEQSRNEPRPR